MDAMPRPRPPHLHRERTRHGEIAWYVRRDHGRRVRIRSAFDTPAFWQEYRDALEGRSPADRKPKPAPHTLAWAIERYRRHSAWARLAPATRRQRENIYRAVVAAAGDKRLAAIDQKHIRDGRERRAAHPHAANNFLKAMRGLFGWALAEELVAADPTKGVPLLQGANDRAGFHTWSDAELERFEARWPLATRERLAYDLLLYTGLRRGDAVRLGRQHVRDGVLAIRAEKTGEEIVIPLLAPLAASIRAAPTGDLTFLVTAAGGAWVKESFGNWFRAVCSAAGVPGSAHGLRKAGATRMALNGATVNQLMAIFGWSTPKMALHYTREADRKRLAGTAARLLLPPAPAQAENEKRPHLAPGEGGGAKRPRKTGA